jgi:hypothetical protein
MVFIKRGKIFPYIRLTEMSSKEDKNIPTTMAAGDTRAIAHLKQAVADGKHWYMALLEAIKLWKSVEEDYQGRHLRYVIDGEAFDWLLLAERLTDEISKSIPEQERINLLFFDLPPLELTREEFKKLIGPAKYRAYLNYLYGVLVEENLIVTVVDEIRKERLASGLNKQSMTLSELKEFTYWLFKYRIKTCDKSRVASDTKKALIKMQRNASRVKRAA